jgi:hypothetical protein
MVVLATFLTLGLASPAHARTDPPPPPEEVVNDAQIDIHGGNTGAFGGCIRYAKVTAGRGGNPNSNACASFASATGGHVSLNSVSVFVDQEGAGRRTRNNVRIDISGGDATAVASCVNFLQGSGTAGDVATCQTAAEAVGGSVTLKDVDITIIQLS